MVWKMDLNLKIIVVDDMPAMRSILKGMLEEVGFTRIVCAEDADVAWQMIRSAALAKVSPPSEGTPQIGAHQITQAVQRDGPFQLVISDWSMPGMTGMDLLRNVRSFMKTRALPFLMVTVHSGSEHMDDAANSGVSNYIVKPFNGEQLAEKIRGLFAVEAVTDSRDSRNTPAVLRRSSR